MRERDGEHRLVAKAYDGAQNVRVASVTVNRPSALASYDPTLRVLRCAAVNNLCDSSALLDGRGTLGPEPNQPNTIGASCADKSAGRYHFDESNDRIRVFTLDGEPFRPGKTVTVEAAVWAYSSYTADKLDLYYAANASNPSWTWIATLTPAGSGRRVLSASYTLPAGSMQAVRARFRYNGSQSPCGSGPFDDHDDLVFAVGDR
jgi:leucyl aminopeptidase